MRLWGGSVPRTLERAILTHPLSDLPDMLKPHFDRIEPTPLLGWREWLVVPDLGIDRIKAKMDTGARTSSLHAFDLEEQPSPHGLQIAFSVCPIQGDEKQVIRATAPLLEHRLVRSSSGHESLRPVIATTIRIGAWDWRIELTLANRDEMGFRMLLGREALRDRFLIDSGRSFLVS